MVRWITSNERSVPAVWVNSRALYTHFSQAAVDPQRDSRERSKYSGLSYVIASFEFLKNLAVLFDALVELSDLSLQLQNRNMTLPKAYITIKRTIRVLESMTEIPGPRVEEMETACVIGKFEGVELHNHKSIKEIKRTQFYRSLANNLKERMMATQSLHVSCVANKDEFENLIADLNVLESENWPDSLNIQYGDANVRRLVKLFKVNEQQYVRGFREYKDNAAKSIPSDLKPLLTAIKSIAISSSECERTFSSMNEIASPKRSSLSIDNLSCLVFINCVGPPLTKFNPEPYVKSWILKGRRTADETACRRRDKKDTNHPYENVWNIM